MEAKWIVVVVIIALLADLVGGILGVALTLGGPMMRMSPMMTSQMMVNPQMMIEMQRQMMANPTLRTQMFQMHRQMHGEMERK